MFKNIAATLQIVERARRGGRGEPKPAPAPPVKLGPMQKIVAFGPLA
jgi:hypothetical protein